MNVLILDVESQGLAATDCVIEVGVALWSVTHATRIAAYSTLVEQASNAAEHVNRIPPAALAEGADEASVWERLAAWLARAEFLIAHNAEFDRRFCPAGWDQGKPFVCSMNDIEWPYSRQRKLVDIALDHGLGVARAHRALSDVELLERLLERCYEMGHDVEDMLRQAARPKALVAAVEPTKRLSANDFAARKAQLQASGFRWTESMRRWTRKIVMENANAFPFEVERV